MDTMPDSKREIPDKNERDLMRRIAGRDRSALEEIYRAYHPKLFKFIFRLTNSYATTDELVNDVLLVVWNKASSFRGKSAVSTWIFGIAYRVTMRRVSRRKLKLVTTFVTDEVAVEPPKLETEDWVQRGINLLPEAQKVAVILVFYLGLSYEEIARITDSPVNTIKTRMFHARRKLRDLLEDTEEARLNGGENEHEQ